MAKFSLALVSLLVLSVYGRPDNYQLSQEQITRYKATAEQWKNVINFNKKPCDEFYNYVCTTYDYPAYYRTEKTEPIGDYIKNYLLSYPQKISEFEQKFVKFQETCKVISQEDKTQWIKDFNFPDTLGGWPAYTPNWQANNFHLQAAIAESTSYDHPVLFQQEFHTDTETFKNYYVVTKENVYDVSAHKEYLQEQLVKYGVIDPQKIILDAFQYQQVYNDAIALVHQSSDIKTDYAGLKKLIPEIDWDHQVTYIFGGQLPNDYPVIIKSEEELQAAWTAISELNPQVIVNYFFVKFITFEHEVDYNQYVKLFAPVLKGAVKKYMLTEPVKQELKEMLISVLEVFQQVFKFFGTGDVEPKIEKFVSENIFGPIDDVALNQDYQKIALVSTSAECLNNFHYLQHVYKKRIARFYFIEKDGKKHYLQREIVKSLITEVPTYTKYSSPFLYNSFIGELVSTVVSWYKTPRGYTTAQKQCYAHQMNKDIDDKQLHFILVNQLLTKAYFEWVKEYPDIVEVENNIFKDYGLSSQKLFTLWLAKHDCADLKTSSYGLAVFWNLPEFASYYQCPAGSKMNPIEKCALW